MIKVYISILFFCTKYNNPIFTGRLFLALVVYQRPQRPNWPLRLGRPWRFGRPGRLCLLLSAVLSTARQLPCLAVPRAAGQVARSGVATGFGAVGGTYGCLGGVSGGGPESLTPAGSAYILGWMIPQETHANNDLSVVAIGLKFKFKHFRVK
jgi:hypothetical protein